jgi:hypothetical protein
LRLIVPFGSTHREPDAIVAPFIVQEVESREYLMKNASEQFSGVMQVQGLLYVAIGLTNGSLIHIDFEHTGDNNFHGGYF